jgi:DNA-binding NarL/FixJ family response regulator
LRQVLESVREVQVGERQPGGPHGEEKVSGREREIGLLVAEGLSSHEIAARLFISPRTVEKHRANLMTKLDVTNAAALTRELLYLYLTEGALA